MDANCAARWVAAFTILINLLFCTGLASAQSIESLGFSVSVLDAYIGEEINLASYLVGQTEGLIVRFKSSAPAIVQTTGEGLAVILGEGRVRITAMDSSGQSAHMDIRCFNAKPARRALLLTERVYDDGRVRTGAVNTVQGISDMLSALRYRTGKSFEITVRVDNTEESIRKTILDVFSDAQDDDINLFYISCHGEMKNGEPHLLMHDGTTLSIRCLEEMLRPVKGRMLVLLDCCQSGSFIGSTASQLYADAASNCFTNSALLNGKYLVITSCGADEDSYRLSETGETNESAMSTVFARALCEGLGWDLYNDRSVSMRADIDRNGIVTFTELWIYTRRRVYYHLSGTGVSQTVMAWPEVNEADLFARQFIQ